MTSLKQIEANRLNALKSTGPRTEQGKQRSRQNALRHGLTAETVITALENAADFWAFEASIESDYCPRSATERELVARLASLLWRLRRSICIETGLFEIQGELLQSRNSRAKRPSRSQPEWYDEFDVAPFVPGPEDDEAGEGSAGSQQLAFVICKSAACNTDPRTPQPIRNRTVAASCANYLHLAIACTPLVAP